MHGVHIRPAFVNKADKSVVLPAAQDLEDSIIVQPRLLPRPQSVELSSDQASKRCGLLNGLVNIMTFGVPRQGTTSSRRTEVLPRVKNMRTPGVIDLLEQPDNISTGAYNVIVVVILHAEHSAAFLGILEPQGFGVSAMLFH